MVYFLALNYKFKLKYSLTEKKMYVSKMCLIICRPYVEDRNNLRYFIAGYYWNQPYRYIEDIGII